jgi:putative transposase
MPRKQRFYLPSVPAHVVQRGNARQAVFFNDGDYKVYLDWLREGADKYGCAIHAFVLMTNHVHLLLTPQHTLSISSTIQHVGRKYVTYVNRRYNRSGTLWEGRHKGSLIHSATYALACSRYIEMNPVRAGMVRSPSDYKWSSYRKNAFGAAPAWLTPLPEYLGLGFDARRRRHAYRELFRDHISDDDLHRIRSCVQTGTPLGDKRFKQQIEAMFGRSVGQNRPGRPSKSSAKDDYKR